MSKQVRATKTGYYNNFRIRVGDVFTVPDGLKGSWFVDADAPKPPAKKAKPEPETLSGIAKKKVTSPIDLDPLGD